MTYAIINNRTNEVMEHVDTMAEAIEVKAQYDEMGKDKTDYNGFNEYYGTYSIEAA
ncbi:MAG: hypothetical protein IKP06_07655 [Elusimicrobiaceae bacterium]|nr:hypothetical protein [Elusimicrobiaceae bacterium]